MTNLPSRENLESGIYQILNTVNGKVYVGSACEFSGRWKAHINDLRANRHGNPHLQSAYNLYGEDSFEFSVLEYVKNRDSLLLVECGWIKKTDAVKNGYNICHYSSSRLGTGHSEESKKKMSKSHTGFKHSEESKEKMSKAQSGKTLSEETKKKISISNTGKSHTKETIRLMSKNSARNIEYKGAIKSVKDWAEHVGIDPGTMSYRIKNWGIKRALTTPRFDYRDTVTNA